VIGGGAADRWLGRDYGEGASIHSGTATHAVRHEIPNVVLDPRAEILGIHRKKPFLSRASSCRGPGNSPVMLMLRNPRLPRSGAGFRDEGTIAGRRFLRCKTPADGQSQAEPSTDHLHAIDVTNAQERAKIEIRTSAGRRRFKFIRERKLNE